MKIVEFGHGATKPLGEVRVARRFVKQLDDRAADIAVVPTTAVPSVGGPAKVGKPMPVIAAPVGFFGSVSKRHGAVGLHAPLKVAV
jgi:hypothetical protein